MWTNLLFSFSTDNNFLHFCVQCTLILYWGWSFHVVALVHMYVLCTDSINVLNDNN